MPIQPEDQKMAIDAVEIDADAVPQDTRASGDGSATELPVSFRQFMLASPLANIELSLPTRSALGGIRRRTGDSADEFLGPIR